MEDIKINNLANMSDEDLRNHCLEMAVSAFPHRANSFGMYCDIKHPLELAEQFYQYVKNGRTIKEQTKD